MKHMAKAADTTDRVYTTRRLEEMGRRKGGRTRKERKRTNHKLPTVKLLACIHDMQKGDGGRAGTSGGEGGQGRVVSGKGQILTTYRGPSSREREGGGGTHPGKRGKPQPNQGGVVGQWHDLPPWRK